MIYGRNVICDDKNKEIIKVFHSKVSAGKRIYTEHHHTECELSLFVAGSGIYTVGKKVYEFNEGDMFLFGSDEPHCITELYTETDLLNIHFEPQLLWQQPENMELLTLFFAKNVNFSNRFSGRDTALKNLILNIEKEISEKLAGYIIETKYRLFSALIYILRRYDYFDKSPNYIKYRLSTEKMKDAMNYINENLSDKLLLKDIAAAACMSQTYFSSVFKKLNGISPCEYITIKRIEKAIFLIKTTNMTMLEIAGNCGFSSSSNFYKAFSKITGKKPTDYLI